MSIKTLVTGDLHLGRRSSDIHHNIPEGSTRHTWEKLVDWCITHRVDILILTGDIVDRDNRYFEAIGPLKSGFEKLKKADIPVYMVAGNHDFDVLQDIVNSAAFDNVHLLGQNGTWEMKVFDKAGEKIQLVGWSFPRQHIQFNPLVHYGSINLDPNHTSFGIIHGDVGNMESNYGRIELTHLLDKKIDVWLLGHIHKP